MPATPAYLLDSSACIPILRNKAGLGKLPSPARTGIPIIVAAELWTGVKKNMTTVSARLVCMSPLSTQNQ